MKGKKLMLTAAMCALGVTCALSLAACGEKDTGPVKLDAEKTSIVVSGYEWGPAVNSVVVKFKGKSQRNFQRHLQSDDRR